MSILWLLPAAFAGLVLLGVPLLIHLLARQKSRRLPFPSLRFLPASQLAALRRKVVEDWPLLLVRLSIVAAAVAAAAAPVIVSEARREAWASRVARAIVVTHSAPEIDAVVESEARESFASARFEAPHLPDAIRNAADWLEAQPPAARELLLVGDVRAGTLSARDFDILDARTGIRVLPMPGDGPAPARLGAIADRAGAAATYRLGVMPTTADTRVAYEPDASVTAPRVRVLAAPDEQPYADALLRAVLREGVSFDRDDPRRITIRFAGAAGEANADLAATTDSVRELLAGHPDVRGGEVDGELIVQAEMAITDARAIDVVSGLLRAALTPAMAASEPRRVPPQELTSWSRPANGIPDDVRPANEGDSRWFWGTALALLAVEQVMRRRRRDG